MTGRPDPRDSDPLGVPPWPLDLARARRILGSLDGYPHTDWLDDLRDAFGMDATTSPAALERQRELAAAFAAVRALRRPPHPSRLRRLIGWWRGG